eukprot:scaffold166696_cov31-Tisochrysis_lutea.AAC.6
MREEGMSAFYRGSQPFVMRAMLVGGTQVATYDQFKLLYGSLGSHHLSHFHQLYRHVRIVGHARSEFWALSSVRSHRSCKSVLCVHERRLDLLDHHHAF